MLLRVFAVFLHLLVACFAGGTIVACIVDYDRRFPNPPFHLSPQRVVVYLAIAVPALIFSTVRIIQHSRAIVRNAKRGG
jgi:hypothetical protein